MLNKDLSSFYFTVLILIIFFFLFKECLRIFHEHKSSEFENRQVIARRKTPQSQYASHEVGVLHAQSSAEQDTRAANTTCQEQGISRRAKVQEKLGGRNKYATRAATHGETAPGGLRRYKLQRDERYI